MGNDDLDLGIAVTATIYQTPHPAWLPAISLTLLTLATIQAITAAVMAVALPPRRRNQQVAVRP